MIEREGGKERRGGVVVMLLVPVAVGVGEWEEELRFLSEFLYRRE